MPDAKMPRVRRLEDRLYITLGGVEHGLSDVEAEWLFMALWRECDPAGMTEALTGRVRKAAQAALALIEVIEAAEVKAQPVSDLSTAQFEELFNGTERALREALAT